MEGLKMKYCVYTNASARTLTAKFDNFEDAKKFVDRKKTKYGHTVVEIGEDGFPTGNNYRTKGNKQ